MAVVQPLAAAFGNTYNQSNKFDGLKATVSIYNENVDPKLFGGAGARITNNLQGRTEAIHFGYAVNPGLYGDKNANFQHLDRMPSSRNHVLQYFDSAFELKVIVMLFLLQESLEILNQSTYVRLQYLVTFQVRQDENGNWWLEVHHGADQVRVVYWPKLLFTGLGDFASDVQFGGRLRSCK
ncbi:hypothetical protein SADUNF_Sadunf12G0107900 [Salix dunnii]|uniref:Neprosin PEP catalytic domain-containing protein n=1 Tax=Salix dunnii TaxID=1413687 RepID=A0A835MMG2_9ROSI|nr:hypothetical protein SADUNF_Sadunf12G0107900 [Salix dunnii]